MSDKGWSLLSYLLTAVDSHRLSNPEPNGNDEALYAKVEQIRKGLA